MPKKRVQPMTFRVGSVRVEAYNEGLAVFVYDQSHRQAIRKARGVELVNQVLDDPNALKDSAIKEFAKSAMLVAYELRQDDAIAVDVIVGPPLTKDELKVVKGLKWRPAQKTVLRLPSGKLCIETANSLRIDPDQDPEDKTQTVDVPPGEYLITVHRVDWTELDDDFSESYTGPGEVITLTPMDDSNRPKRFSPALNYSVRKPSAKWIGGYTIEDGTFHGQVNFWDYWEIFRLNLDREAFAALKLGFGSLLEFEIKSRTFRVAYLGESLKFGLGHLELYKTILGNDLTTKSLSDFPEVAFGIFNKPDPEGPEVISCLRVKASKPFDVAKHETWHKVDVHVRSDRLAPADRSLFGRWTRDGGVLRGQILVRSEQFLTVNFDSSAIETLGVKPGDRLALNTERSRHQLVYFADAEGYLAARKSYDRSSGDREQEWDKVVSQLRHAEAREDQAAASRARRTLKEIRTADPALAAMPDQHWYEPDQTILVIRTLSRDMKVYEITFDLDVDVKPGDCVSLEKIK
jgi:hypothetical protein